MTATFKTGPENTSARIALLKYVDGGTGKTWFDDISVIEIGTQLVSEEKPIREILTEKNYDNFYFGATISVFSTDGTLGDNSDTALVTEKAIRTFVENQLGGGQNNLTVNSAQIGEITISGANISASTGNTVNFTTIPTTSKQTSKW